MIQSYYLKELKIEVTSKCPLVCIHCSSEATPTAQIQISPQKCQEIIKDGIKLGVKDIVLSGGEPLLWENIVEAVRFANENNIYTTIYTSGNVPNFNELIYLLVQSGLSRVVFSVYGADSIVHDYFTRVNGSFFKTINAVDCAIKLGLTTEAHFVAFAENYKQVTKVVPLLIDLGVKRVSILRFVPQGRGVLASNQVLSRYQNIDLGHRIKKLRSQGYDIRTGSPFNSLLINSNPKCMSGVDRLCIGPDLKIYPCDAFKQLDIHDYLPNARFNSLTECSLQKCWEQSSFLSEVRKWIKYPPENPCKDCQNYPLCLGGCLAQKVLYYGSFSLKPDPSCILGRANSNG